MVSSLSFEATLSKLNSKLQKPSGYLALRGWALVTSYSKGHANYSYNLFISLFYFSSDERLNPSSLTLVLFSTNGVFYLAGWFYGSMEIPDYNTQKIINKMIPIYYIRQLIRLERK